MRARVSNPEREGEFFIDKLLVRILFIIETIWWTGLTLWDFEFHVSCSRISTFLVSNPDAQNTLSAFGLRAIRRVCGSETKP
jgi:hypothetical protein